ncbi:MAG: hypothetical protein IJE10_10105 [Clostridia bacterium]|nr:hypothetical protein [Clostridia bacterium]
MKRIGLLFLAGLLLVSFTACDMGNGEQEKREANLQKAKLEEQKQKGKDAAGAAIEFLNNLTELRWDEACAMAETELETRMPGINSPDWGVTDESLALYEEILRVCMQNGKNVVADKENVRFSDGQCVVRCEVSAPKLQTFMDIIASNGWKTPEEAEINTEVILSAPRETVYVTLLLTEEKEQDGLTAWKVCAESDISALGVIFN